MSRQPTAKELTALRKEYFGTEAGAVHVDTDPRTGETTLVYVDGSGAEVSREPWDPDAYQLPVPMAAGVLTAPGSAEPEVYRADRRLYLDAAGGVVLGDDPARERLLVSTGSSLPAADARRYGLLDNDGNRLEPWGSNAAVKGAAEASRPAPGETNDPPPADPAPTGKQTVPETRRSPKAKGGPKAKK